MGMPKGFRHTEATKDKMRKAHTGVKFSEERKAVMKAAAQKREERRRASQSSQRQSK